MPAATALPGMFASARQVIAGNADADITSEDQRASSMDDGNVGCGGVGSGRGSVAGGSVVGGSVVGKSVVDSNNYNPLDSNRRALVLQ